MGLFTRGLLVGLVVVAASALPLEPEVPAEWEEEIRIPSMFLGRRRDGFVQRNHHASQLDSALSGSGYINQILDHFDADNTATWKQRYFFNLELQTKPNVNFLYIGGEGPESIDSIATAWWNPLSDYAKQYGAGLYSLEHRFYGESHPTDDITTESLKFLSSRQALEDLAAFIRLINTRNKIDNPQWVIFGGSYAGNLALWFRQNFPDLVVGALGSSGPVLAQLDFYGYLQVVEDNIRTFDSRSPSGNRECYGSLQTAIQKVNEMMQTDAGRAKLTDDFNLSPGFTSVDDVTDNSVSMLYQAIVNPWMGAAQYGGPNSIAELCYPFILPTADSYKTLAALMKSEGGPLGVNTNYTRLMALFNLDQWKIKLERFNIEFNNPFLASRAWTYQTCTEFGYFQSTDRGSNLFGSIVPSNFYINMCTDMFGLSSDQVKASIDATNLFYGERQYYKGTNVVITRGSGDPWHFLTKQDSTHYSVVVYEVPDGTHCNDMGPACDSKGANCDAGVQLAQTLLTTNIDAWLNGPSQSPQNLVLDDHTGQRPVQDDVFTNAPARITYATQEEASANYKKRLLEAKRADSGKLREFMYGRSTKHGLVPPAGPMTPDWPPNMLQAWITQPWDHFDNLNPNRFLQQFFVNEDFGSTDGPNFLMIGGEGPESSAWVTNTNYTWMQYAQAVGANAYVLEHRYYGASKLGTNDLKYLTSAQMLYDIARFIKYAQKERGLTGPWITFGGSYSGALSAWAREWFPDLILGAVASSAPVEAKNDFFEYLEVVQDVLLAHSPDCHDRTSDAFTEIHRLTQTPDGRAQLTDKFKIVPGWPNTDRPIPVDHIQLAIGQMYNAYMGVVQYSGDNAGSARRQTVDALCEIVMDAKYNDDILGSVRGVQEWVYGSNVQTGSLPASENMYLREMRDHLYDGTYSDAQLATVLWIWQTCNEFGYYQTTDYGYGIFGNPTPLNQFIGTCESVYYQYMDQIEDNIRQSQYQYGGKLRYKGSNVVFINGDSDPWHRLSLLDTSVIDNKDSVTSILIEGTAHCADMYPASDDDAPGLPDARAQTLAQIQSWLKQAPPPDTGTTSSPGTTDGSKTQTTTAGVSSASVSALIMALLAFFVL